MNKLIQIKDKIRTHLDQAPVLDDNLLEDLRLVISGFEVDKRVDEREKMLLLCHAAHGMHKTYRVVFTIMAMFEITQVTSCLEYMLLILGNNETENHRQCLDWVARVMLEIDVSSCLWGALITCY
jgi:hypothetical protein